MTDKLQSITAREFGKQFAKGVLWDFLLPLYGGFVVLAVIIAIAMNAWGSRDSTDSPTKRSNMALRIDHGTGCQYLASKEGHLTPRMGRDGKQVCN
jgi:hypothetical protein